MVAVTITIERGRIVEQQIAKRHMRGITIGAHGSKGGKQHIAHRHAG
jgi:hypothetical protein